MTARLQLPVHPGGEKQAGVAILPAARVHGADAIGAERLDQRRGELRAGAVLTDDHHATRDLPERGGERGARGEPAQGHVPVPVARPPANQRLQQMVNGDAEAKPKPALALSARGLGASDA